MSATVTFDNQYPLGVRPFFGRLFLPCAGTRRAYAEVSGGSMVELSRQGRGDAMNRKVAVIGMGLVVATMVSGCASVNPGMKLNGQMLTPSDKPVAHLNASTWGIYWLPMFPVMTGSTDKPGKSSFFKDTVTVENVVDMATAKSKELGATKTTDLQSHTTSILVFPVPPFLLWYKAVEVSGNAVK